MSSSVDNKTTILLTGEPGSGKTTLIKEVITKAEKNAGGFYTEEIRERGARKGFKIVTLDGKEAVLSHVDIKSTYRVSKYGVDLGAIDELAVPAIEEATKSCDIVVIDEIGKMELYSSRFKEAVNEALDSGKKVLGTIMLASNPVANKIKERPDLVTILVSKTNRDQVRKELLSWLQ